jgi:hypothetical protein
MRIKPKILWAQRFPRAAPAALALLEKLLMFDPDDRSELKTLSLKPQSPNPKSQAANTINPKPQTLNEPST